MVSIASIVSGVVSCATIVCDSQSVLTSCGPGVVCVGTVLCAMSVVCTMEGACEGIGIGLEVMIGVGRGEERVVLSTVVVSL